MADYALTKWLNSAAAPSTTASVVIEALESRRLLSASLGAGIVDTIASPSTATVVAPSVKTYGVTLHLQAGQSFDGYLGVVAGARVDTRSSRISASINWGDHSQAGLGVAIIGASGNIDVGGAHAYSASGDYSITITVSVAPIPVPGQPTPTHILVLGTIKSEAIVAGKTADGVEIAETVNVPFTATIGSFKFTAPAKGLSATINWGDGTSSAAATLKASGTSGLIRLDVSGTHTYAKPGEYAIRIVIFQKLGSASSQVASIDSKAVVTSAITGTYKLAPAIPDAGATYVFSGTGITGTLPLTFTGSVTLPGLVTSGIAAGKLTLKTSEGSVIFSVTGPVEKGFGPFPGMLKYVITGSTSTYAGTTGSGVISVALNASHQTFVAEIEPSVS